MTVNPGGQTKTPAGAEHDEEHDHYQSEHKETRIT